MGGRRGHDRHHRRSPVVPRVTGTNVALRARPVNGEAPGVHTGGAACSTPASSPSASRLPSCATAFVATPVASAKGGDGVKVRGACTQSSTAKLKLSREDRGVEVEFEVDQNRNGVPWKVTLRRNGSLVASTIVTTHGPSGSFSLHRVTAGALGQDRRRRDARIRRALLGSGRDLSQSRPVASPQRRDGAAGRQHADARDGRARPPLAVARRATSARGCRAAPATTRRRAAPCSRPAVRRAAPGTCACPGSRPAGRACSTRSIASADGFSMSCARLQAARNRW